MTKPHATATAQGRADETGTPFLIYRVGNGQWMFGPNHMLSRYDVRDVQTIVPREMKTRLRVLQGSLQCLVGQMPGEFTVDHASRMLVLLREFLAVPSV